MIGGLVVDKLPFALSLSTALARQLRQGTFGAKGKIQQEIHLLSCLAPEVPRHQLQRGAVDKLSTNGWINSSQSLKAGFSTASGSSPWRGTSGAMDGAA